MLNFSLLSRQLALCMLVGLSPLMASEGPLHAAKDAKQACELPNGTVKALVSDPGIQALVAEKNQARLKKYQEIAQSQGTDIAVVSAIAAQEIAQRYPNHICP